MKQKCKESGKTFTPPYKSLNIVEEYPEVKALCKCGKICKMRLARTLDDYPYLVMPYHKKK